MEHPRYGYEMMLPDVIVRQTLQTIEQLPKAQRGWLTQVYHGNPSSDARVSEDYKEAREHLFRIGYRPASEEAEPVRRKARKGIGSH